MTALAFSGPQIDRPFLDTDSAYDGESPDSVARKFNLIDVSDSERKADRPDALTTDVDCETVSFKEAQRNDKILQSYWRRAEKGSNEYKVFDGLLYKRTTLTDLFGSKEYVLVLPQVHHSEIIRLAHDSLAGAHLGVRKTCERISREFFIPKMRHRVAKHIKVCHQCQIHKERKTSERQPLQSVDVMSRAAFSDVSMDIIAREFPVTSRRNRYLLTIVCNVTGWICAYPMPNCKADTVADRLLDFCCDKAFPEIIRSDNFTSFRSQLITAIREKFGIEMKLSAPYHAASHGKIEQHNRSIQDMLRKFISDHPRDWDQIIKFLLYALREVPNASTGYSPYQLVYA